MSLAPNDLFLAATAADGSVYTATRNAASGTWSAFAKLTGLDLPRFKNVGVTVTPESQVVAINNAPVRQLRYVYDNGGSWSSPLLLTAGVSPAAAAAASGSLGLATLAIGPHTVAGWSFGLPLYLVDADQKTIHAAGDQLARIDVGKANPSDPAVALDMTGTFNTTEQSFQLCLATQQGLVYHADLRSPGRAPLTLISSPLGTLDQAVSVSCTESQRGLHLCWVERTGTILHRLRFPDGTWSGSGNINAAAGTTETFAQTALSHYDLPGGGGVLHLVAVTRTGRLLYTNRTAEETADPIWAPFRDITGALVSVTSVDIGAHP